ncbi:MAG: MurR/RpiR family transcriptional regulator [Lachnospiraceae bacterium]|nr:MurR/RpiR family transcriptional regulator [Lachnospiraceae bacterium]
MSVLEVLTENYSSFTRQGKKLADYIFAHAADAQYLSISTLAEKSGVSEATVTRFCRQLGLSGYNDFKLALAKADRRTDLGDPSDSPETITSEDSLESMFQKLHRLNVKSLSETLELLSAPSISLAVSILSGAERVYCFGSGGSMVMAMEAWARFSTASPNFVHIADSHMQVMAAALCTQKDVILFFSYSGSTKDMEDVLDIAKKRGAKIIVVTHFVKSKAAEFADVVLVCGYNESPLQSGSIAAKVGQMFIIECLFYGFCQRNAAVSSDNRTATVDAITRKLL